MRVKAKVVWVQNDEERQCQFCGVQFTDFSGKAWSRLCLMYEKYRDGSSVSDADLLDKFDLERLQEGLSDTSEALDATAV